MCGRYTLKTDAGAIAAELGLDETPALQPRYNIAPTQGAPIVIAPGRLTIAQWGLIPRWASDPAVGGRLINARSETLEDKPAFREAFKRRRCLVVADGFYEWQRAGKASQPFFISLESGRPFTLAGLWEPWRAPSGIEWVSFAIVTTAADRFMTRLHDRMPVLVAAEQRARWLAPTEDVAGLAELFRPGPPAHLTAYPVERHVNQVAADDPRCLERAGTVQLPLL